MRYLLAFVAGLIIVSFYSSVSAKEVDINTAQTVARNCYYEKINSQSKVDYNNIIINESITESNKSVNLLYIFNFSNNGFVIVSADDATYPIIGYSLDSKFINENKPDNLNFWIEHYKKEINSIIDSKFPTTDDITAQWNHYLTKPKNVNQNNKSITIAPLLTARWDQGLFYNTLCPADTAGPGGHAIVGCVATAMAMVMYYYRYPTTGVGTHTYTHYMYGPLTVNPGTTTYDWTSMADNLSAMNNAVATISYQAGVTVDMDYSPTASGAYMNDAAEALQSHFRYNYIPIEYKDNNTYAYWITLLKSNLDIGRPLIYAGYDVNGGGGHAFVCDGYDSNDNFHFNWGWGGGANGFYTVNSLNPYNSYNFINWELALTDIYPSSNYPYNCSGTTTITSRSGNIDDGSGPANYQNNNDCRWLIAPTRATDIYLYFNNISTEPTNDVVIVYDGATTSDSILGTFSGNTLPSTIHSTGGQMLVRFITNGNTTSSGWRASFYANVSPICSALITLTAPSDTFSDGSGNAPYDYSTLCDWKINPPGATYITLGFTSFDISTSDKVRIVDIAQNPAVVLDTYTGNTIPQTKTYNSDNIVVVFNSTNITNGQGWNAFYSSNATNITNNKDLSNNINIYPNPTNSSFTIKGYDNNSVLKIFNLTGQLLKKVNLYNIETVIDVNDFAKGFYLLNVISDKNNYFCKIIKD